MDRPKIGVGVFIINNNKILLGKRKNSHGSGTWGLPGGHLEFSETFEECAKKEVMEETGLDIGAVTFETLTNDIFKEEAKHYVTIFVKSEYIEGDAKIMEVDKCEQWDWFDWDEMPEPLFLPLENLRKTGYTPY
jgi:8-oxo-dGTP diphosphatase